MYTHLKKYNNFWYEDIKHLWFFINLQSLVNSHALYTSTYQRTNKNLFLFQISTVFFPQPLDAILGPMDPRAIKDRDEADSIAIVCSVYVVCESALSRRPLERALIPFFCCLLLLLLLLYS